MDRVLGHHVEADGGLVEKQHLGLVQERRDELELHPLAEREFADRLEDQLPHAEQVDEFVPRLLKTGRVDPIDLLMQPKTLGSRQVPPELVPLSHHERKPAAEVIGPLPGHVAEHGRRAPGGRDDPGEELQERRLAGTVGAEQGHELAAADRQINPLHRLHHAAGAMKERPDARRQPLGLVEDAVLLGETFDADDWLGHRGGRGRIGVVHGGSIGENRVAPRRRRRACSASDSVTTRTALVLATVW